MAIARAAAALLFPLSSLVAQATWVVATSPGPGVNFTSLPAAVATAASGDTLLVGPGSYGPFQVSGKALSIFGAGNGSTRIDQAGGFGSDYVLIQSPPAGTCFRMAGLAIQPSMPATGGPSSMLTLGGGTVCLTDVSSLPLSGPGVGLRVNGATVFANRCSFRGGVTYNPVSLSYIGNAGGSLLNAQFFAQECTAVGGGLTFAFATITCGDGLTIDSSEAVLSHCAVRGGGVSMFAGSATGGPGLRVLGASVVQVSGSAGDTIRGGDVVVNPGTGTGGVGLIATSAATVRVHAPVALVGGSGTTAGAAVSGTGVPTFLGGLPLTTLAGSLHANGDLVASAPVTLAIDGGPAGQVFALLFDLQPGVFSVPGLSQQRLELPLSSFFVAVGLLDGAGHFAWTFTPTTLAPALLGTPTHWQSFAWDPAAAQWLGSNCEIQRWRL